MNDNRKTITGVLIGTLVLLAVIIFITIINSLTGFTIMFSVLFVLLIICLGIYSKEAPDEFTIFIKEKKKILRTYDSIIVEVEDIPNIAGKNIIKVKTIEDLVDAQLELREPIYYKNDNDSCFFILLHYNEACIYILKMNNDVISPTEQSIRYMKEDKDAKKSADDESILDNLENTIVYKLDELRSFKISPVRNSKEIEVVDDKAIKEEIEHSKENKLTKEELEEEISKTMYIKDLKEKIQKYEEQQKEIDEEFEEENISIQQILEAKEKAEEKKESKEVKKEVKKEAKKEDKKAPKATKKKVQTKTNTHQTKRTANYSTKQKSASKKK